MSVPLEPARQEITLISYTPTSRVKSQITWLQITSVVVLTIPLFYYILPKFVFYFYTAKVFPLASWIKQSEGPESKNIKLTNKNKC